MFDVKEKPTASTTVSVERRYFQVFLSFRKPDGHVSFFIEGMPSDCGIYDKLARIFNRMPREIYESVCSLAKGQTEAFMQEYLSLDDASGAVAQAALFAHTSGCLCFLKQEGCFYIKETRK